jgi:hypothetical protein
VRALRPYVSRVLAPFVAAFVVWLGGRLGIPLPGVAESLTELLTLAVLAVLSGVGHKVLDRRINPLDTAVVPEGPRVREALLHGHAGQP